MELMDVDSSFDLGRQAPTRLSLPGISQGRSQSSDPPTRLSTAIPQLSLLQSPALLTCAAYQTLLTHLQSFYLDPQQCLQQFPGKSRIWLNVVYNELYKSLHCLLGEVDPDLQEKQVETVYTWFMKKTGRVKSLTPVTARDFFITRPRASTPISPHPRPPTSYVTHTHQQSVHESFLDDHINTQVKEVREQQQREFRSACVTHRLVAQWSRRKTREEEALLMKYEGNTQVRTQSAPRNVRTPTTAAESTVQQPETVVCYVQPELSDVSYEEYEVDYPPAIIQSRIQRLRSVHRDVYQDVCSTGYYHRNLPSLSAYHPRTSRRPVTSHKSAYTQQENTEDRLQHCAIEDMRRKLVHQKVPCSYKVLQMGLRRPDRVSPEKQLPVGGEYFTSNPFFPVKKKTGKGKKKRSK